MASDLRKRKGTWIFGHASVTFWLRHVWSGDVACGSVTRHLGTPAFEGGDRELGLRPRQAERSPPVWDFSRMVGEFSARFVRTSVLVLTLA